MENNKIKIDWKPDKNIKMPLYKQIFEYIHQKISCGDWASGSKLPSQRELSVSFNVNRSTIVAAMNDLISFGILDSDFGGGTKVSGNAWSMYLTNNSPNWSKYLKSGAFKANLPTIQAINTLEFNEQYVRLSTGELPPEFLKFSKINTVFENAANKISSLGYLEPLGLYELRKAISKRLATDNIFVPESGILITSGSLQALQLISVCLLQKGSTVYSESPSYLKSLQVFQSAGMNLKGISMDNEGIQYWKSGTENHGDFFENSLLYTIPTFHNPTGILMSEERRRKLSAYCIKTRLPIIEDSAYSELWLESKPPLPLKAFDKNGNILYVGTTSKSLAPGLRVGWIVGPESVVNRLADVKMQMDYGASSISQWVLSEYYDSGLYDDFLLKLRKELLTKRNNAIEALNKYFKDIADFNIPLGGFYIWLRIKKHISTDLLFNTALQNNILLNPGSLYDYTQNNAIRISYSYLDCDSFTKSIKTLSAIVSKLN